MSTPEKTKRTKIPGIDSDGNVKLFKFNPAKAIHKRVLIIGSGPAGWTSAIYAARAGLEPHVLKGPQPGGQLTTTTEVENYPCFWGSGPNLVKTFEQHALKSGASASFGVVGAADFSKRPFRFVTQAKKYFTADACIIAVGATARYLGIESEEKFKNQGVSACATCDGPMFKGMPTAVVGGGDSSMEEALYLANLCPKVYIIHRRDFFRSSKVMLKRAREHPKIEFLVPYTVKEIKGSDEDGVTSLDIKHSDGTIKNIPVRAMFVAIGHVPNTKLFSDGCTTVPITLDPQGYIKTIPGTSKTNVEGVFAVGDCQDRHYRQAVTAAGSGCMGAIDAERWLSEQPVSSDVSSDSSESTTSTATTST